MRRQTADVRELIERATYETCRVNGYTVYRGTVPSVESVRARLPEGFREVEKWASNGFRYVWVSDKERSTVTYCEGDLLVTRHETEEEYRRELEHSEAFYREH